MKIGVFQPDIGAIGGSITALLSFADTFKGLGHTVIVFGTINGSKNILKNVRDVLRHHQCKNIVDSDVILGNPAVNIPKANVDFLFYTGRYHGRVKDVKVPKVLWTITRIDLKPKINVLERWTNSNTTKRSFGNRDDMYVTVTPIDYTIFRQKAKVIRPYDVVAILRGNDYKDKGIQLYSTVIKKLNVNGLLITTTYGNNFLTKLKKSGVAYVANKTKEEVATFLGSSKTMFLPSYKESCPLVIYEALNAGVLPVTRKVGAVKEQLGGHGFIFNKDNEAHKTLKEALKFKSDPEDLIERGRVFDRENVRPVINERLRAIEKKLFGFVREVKRPSKTCNIIKNTAPVHEGEIS